MKFVIFGTGTDGLIVCDFIGKDNIAFAIDSNENKQGGFFLDKEIYPPESCVDLLEGQSVCVIVSSVKYEDEMVKRLRDNHILNYITRKEIESYFVEKKITLKDDRNKQFVFSVLEHIENNHNDLRQDMESYVEFYLVDSFEISHYLPIYRQLISKGIKARIIAEPRIINTGGEWFDYEKAISILKKSEIDYRDIANPMAKVAITTQYSKILNHYRDAKKIQLSYGVALLKSAAFLFFDGVAESFDYVFIHGRIQKEILEGMGAKTEIVDVSYPRYEGVSADKSEILYRNGIVTDKPIMVYLPTWDEYGSIRELAEQFEGLKSEFCLVTKPHHCTMHLPEKEAEKNYLYKIFDYVLEEMDLYDVAKIADLAICDAKSAAVSEIVYLNPKVKLLLIYKNCNSDDFWYDFSTFAAGMSVEDCLSEHVHELVLGDDHIEQRQQEIGRFFTKSVQSGTKRASDAIIKIITEEEKNS